MKKISIVVAMSVASLMISGCATNDQPKVVVKVVERTGFEIPKSLQDCPVTPYAPWKNDAEFATYALKAIGDGPNCRRKLIAVIKLWEKWKASQNQEKYQEIKKAIE